MRIEYMCYGYCNGQAFREFFASLEQAKDWAIKFKRWHGGNDYCKVAKCEIEEVEV